MTRRMDVHRIAQMAVQEEVQSMASLIWPQAVVRVYGSSLTGLALPTSDIDVVIQLAPTASYTNSGDMALPREAMMALYRQFPFPEAAAEAGGYLNLPLPTNSQGPTGDYTRVTSPPLMQSPHDVVITTAGEYAPITESGAMPRVETADDDAVPTAAGEGGLSSEQAVGEVPEDVDSSSGQVLPSAQDVTGVLYALAEELYKRNWACEVNPIQTASIPVIKLNAKVDIMLAFALPAIMQRFMGHMYPVANPYETKLPDGEYASVYSAGQPYSAFTPPINNIYPGEAVSYSTQVLDPALTATAENVQYTDTLTTMTQSCYPYDTPSPRVLSPRTAPSPLASPPLTRVSSSKLASSPVRSLSPPHQSSSEPINRYPDDYTDQQQQQSDIFVPQNANQQSQRRIVIPADDETENYDPYLASSQQPPSSSRSQQLEIQYMNPTPQYGPYPPIYNLPPHALPYPVAATAYTPQYPYSPQYSLQPPQSMMAYDPTYTGLPIPQQQYPLPFPSIPATGINDQSSDGQDPSIAVGPVDSISLETREARVMSTLSNERDRAYYTPTYNDGVNASLGLGQIPPYMSYVHAVIGSAVGVMIPIDITIEAGEHKGISTCDYIMKEIKQMSPILPSVVKVVKHLLSSQGLNVPFSGGLSSYSVFLMVCAAYELCVQEDERIKASVTQEKFVEKDVSESGIRTADPTHTINTATITTGGGRLTGETTREASIAEGADEVDKTRHDSTGSNTSNPNSDITQMSFDNIFTHTKPSHPSSIPSESNEIVPETRNSDKNSDLTVPNNTTTTLPIERHAEQHIQHKVTIPPMTEGRLFLYFLDLFGRKFDPLTQGIGTINFACNIYICLVSYCVLLLFHYIV